MPFTVSDEERQELAVTYAALILNDDKAPITAENIQKLVSAAKVNVEPYWPSIFAKLLAVRDVDELLLNAGAAGPSSGGGGGGGGAAAGGGAPAAEEAAPEPEEESEEEEDMGFSLFD